MLPDPRSVMRVCATNAVVTVDRDSILEGIIHAWRCKPEKRKDTLRSSKFPTLFEEPGLLVCYELDPNDLKDLFRLLKRTGIAVDRDLSCEEKRKSEEEQQKIYNFLKQTLKEHATLQKFFERMKATERLLSL